MKISKRISDLLSGQGFQYSNFSKGNNSVKKINGVMINSVKNASRVMVLVLCISSDHALYLYKVS